MSIVDFSGTAQAVRFSAILMERLFATQPDGLRRSALK